MRRAGETCPKHPLSQCHSRQAICKEALPDHPFETDPDIQAVGLKDKINLVNGPTLINFYLPNDSALASWTAGNASYKPQSDLGYGYSAGSGVFHETFDTSGSHRRHLISPSGLNEAMGYAVQSRTVAAGANGRVNGSISAKVDMNEFEFEDVHSAEWVKPFQKTYNFWLRLADSLRLNVFESQ